MKDIADQKVWFFTDCPEDGEDETEESVAMVEVCFDVEVTDVPHSDTSKPQKLKLHKGLEINTAGNLLDDLNPKTTCSRVKSYGWFRVTFDHNDGVS